VRTIRAPACAQRTSKCGPARDSTAPAALRSRVASARARPTTRATATPRVAHEDGRTWTLRLVPPDVKEVTLEPDE
jgi:hypothetical protein